MVIRGIIRIAGKVVVVMGVLLALSACVAAGIGALAAGGALGATAGAATKPHPPPPAHDAPAHRTDHSPPLLPVTPNY